jgi:hypothetical protein
MDGAQLTSTSDQDYGAVMFDLMSDPKWRQALTAG